MEPLCLFPTFFLSAAEASSSEYLAGVLGEESIRAWGARALVQCGQLSSLPLDPRSRPCQASLCGAGQGAAEPRSVFHPQTRAEAFAPCNHLGFQGNPWEVKPNQLMSQGDFSYLPTPLTRKLQLAKCQQKLLLLPMRWIALAVKIISDVLLRCLMGLLFKHGWCKISPRHYSQQVIESHLMSIFRTE